MSRQQDKKHTATLNMRSTSKHDAGTKFNRDAIAEGSRPILHVVLTNTRDNKYYEGELLEATLRGVVSAAGAQDDIILADATELYEENDRDSVPPEKMKAHLQQISDNWFMRNKPAFTIAALWPSDDLKEPLDTSKEIARINSVLSRERPSIALKSWSEFKKLAGEDHHREEAIYKLVAALLDESRVLKGSTIANNFSKKDNDIATNCNGLANEVFQDEAITKHRDSLIEIFGSEESVREFLGAYFSEATKWARKKYNTKQDDQESDSDKTGRMDRNDVNALLNNSDALEVVLKKFKSSVKFLVREYVGMAEIIFHYRKDRYAGVNVVYPSTINQCLVAAWNLLFDKNKETPVYWSDLKYKSIASPSNTPPKVPSSEQVRSPTKRQVKVTDAADTTSSQEQGVTHGADKILQGLKLLSILAEQGHYVPPEWITALLLYSPHKERREVQPDVGKQNFFTAFSESGHAQQSPLMPGNANGSYE